MKIYLKNNILIYIASLGILAFVPIVADREINSFNLLAFVFGIIWILFFIIVWLMRNTIFFVKHSDWVTTNKHTGYFRFKNTLVGHDFKINGLPCKLVSKNTIFWCETDILNVENINHIEYVKRK